MEGWHNKFQKLIKCHDPTIWKFFYCMLIEQNSTENVIKKIESGENELNLQNMRNRDYNDKIKAIVNKYKQKGKFPTFKAWIKKVASLQPCQK